MLIRTNAGGFPPVEILRAPDAETGATPAAEPAATTVESVLFPDDKPAPEAAVEQTPNEAAKPDEAKTDWKEYEPDPAKSEAENEAAKAEHDKAKPAAPDPLDVVPEDGKYTLTMPEGVEPDGELLEALGADFKDLGLTNKAAQRLADKFIAVNQARVEKHLSTPAGMYSALSHQFFLEQGTPDTWEGKAKVDTEIGGERWNSTKVNAQRVVNQFATPAFREVMNKTGFGNHPEVIRFVSKVGDAIKEDNPATGGAEGASKPAEAAYRLFPNDVPKGH